MVVTWSMEASLPPRFQLAGVPLVWSRPVPVSNVELTQKLPETSGGTFDTDKSSMIITPVRIPEPPETSEARIFTAPNGTSNNPFRFVKVEASMVPAAGVGGAGGDEVNLSDDSVGGVKEKHGQAHLMVADVVHFEPLHAQGVTGGGMAGELDIGVPFPVEIAGVRVDDRQGMTGAREIVGDDHANRGVVAAPIPIEDGAIGLVKAGAQFEGRVHPEVT